MDSGLAKIGFGDAFTSFFGTVSNGLECGCTSRVSTMLDGIPHAEQNGIPEGPTIKSPEHCLQHGMASIGIVTPCPRIA
jgi:hypothetical protein